MSVVVLNMKFVMTDIQFAPLNSILLFILNILLANILPAEYSDEYPGFPEEVHARNKFNFH